MGIRGIIVHLLLFSSGLILRKLGIPGGQVIILLSGLSLFSRLFYTGIKKAIFLPVVGNGWTTAPELLLSFAFFFLLLRHQYWFPGNAFAWLSLLCLLISTCFLLFGRKAGNSFSFPPSYYFTRGYRILLVFIWVLLIPSLVMSPREFHNFFRATTYEEYVRQSHDEDESDIADALIEKYKCTSPACMEKADTLFKRALEKDRNKENEEALRLYNLSIDLDPDNAEAYYRRGLIKFFRLDINESTAWSAVKDYSRSLKLRPGAAAVLYHRGVAFSYLGQKTRACDDLHAAVVLDNTLPVSYLIKKNCPAEGTRVPVH